MEEKDIIKNLKRMKKVSPDKSWVLANKREILGEDSSYSVFGVAETFFKNLIVVHKLASVVALALFLLTGTVIYAQGSLPGDALYSVRKATENIRFAFRADDQPKLSFEVVQRRMEDLDRVVKSNSSRNLAPAINELQASVSEAVKNVKVKEDMKAVSDRLARIEAEKERMETLGIEIGENEELNDLKQKLACKNAKEEISFTETRTLTDSQEELLAEAKDLLEEGKCQKALDKILIDFELPEPEDEEEEEVEADGEEE